LKGREVEERKKEGYLIIELSSMGMTKRGGKKKKKSHHLCLRERPEWSTANKERGEKKKKKAFDQFYLRSW